jgi:hypothetical protein
MGLLASPGGIVAVFPGGGVGLFGPTGFTRRPAITNLLASYELDDPRADVVRFDGVPRRVVARLLALLPANQADVGTDAAPSFREMLDLAADCPSARFHGYRTSPRRFDERVALLGFTVRRKELTSAMRERVARFTPCALEHDRQSVTICWA